MRWGHIITVLSAAVLIGTEVFGAAFAVGWALASVLSLDDYFGSSGVYVVQGILCAIGVYVMIAFCRLAFRAEGEDLVKRE
jgi:hypothetical protein